MTGPVKKILISLLMLVLGIVLIIFSFKKKQQLADPTLLKITAVISDITVENDGDETKHHVFVDYELNGKTVTGQLDGYSSGMKIGKNIEILVDEGNPSEVMENSKASYRIMLGMGIVVILLGVLSFFKS